MERKSEAERQRRREKESARRDGWIIRATGGAKLQKLKETSLKANVIISDTVFQTHASVCHSLYIKDGRGHVTSNVAVLNSIFKL